MNSLISIVVAFVIAAFPIFIITFYNRNKVLEGVYKRDENFSNKFGYVLAGLNLKRRGRLALVYLVASTIRKLLFVVTVVFM